MIREGELERKKSLEDLPWSTVICQNLEDEDY